MQFGPKWTAEEDAKLREAYASGGIATAVAVLPGRSPSAVEHRARYLGVRARRNWTAADDAKLRWEWNEGNRIGEVARLLGRTKWSCYWRAGVLGLRQRCPAGREHLTTAANRAGFSRPQLRRILKAAGVPMRVSYVRPGRVAYRCHTVDPNEVDEAVARWVRA